MLQVGHLVEVGRPRGFDLWHEVVGRDNVEKVEMVGNHEGLSGRPEVRVELTGSINVHWT